MKITKSVHIARLAVHFASWLAIMAGQEMCVR